MKRERAESAFCETTREARAPRLRRRRKAALYGLHRLAVSAAGDIACCAPKSISRSRQRAGRMMQRVGAGRGRRRREAEHAAVASGNAARRTGAGPGRRRPPCVSCKRATARGPSSALREPPHASRQGEHWASCRRVARHEPPLASCQGPAEPPPGVLRELQPDGHSRGAALHTSHRRWSVPLHGPCSLAEDAYADSLRRMVR